MLAPHTIEWLYRSQSPMVTSASPKSVCLSLFTLYFSGVISSYALSSAYPLYPWIYHLRIKLSCQKPHLSSWRHCSCLCSSVFRNPSLCVFEKATPVWYFSLTHQEELSCQAMCWFVPDPHCLEVVAYLCPKVFLCFRFRIGSSLHRNMVVEQSPSLSLQALAAP